MNDAAAILAFVRETEALKDTLRSGRTASGKRESTAEHSWRLCLFAMLASRHIEPPIDTLRLLELCIVHDLGELYCGDIPAITQQVDDGRDARERDGFVKLVEHLPTSDHAHFMALYDEYSDGETREAKIAKGLDKLETMLQHTQGKNAADFDYGFNLSYGVKWTQGDALISALRAMIDAETERLHLSQSADN